MKILTGAPAGLYAIVTWHVLRHLRRWKELNGEKVHILLKNSLYNDPIKGPNMWEYYYEQIDPIEGIPQYLGEKDMPQEVDLYEGMNIRQTLGVVYKKYIHYNELTQKIINKQLSFFDTYPSVLGVHIRKTDKRIDTPGNQNINDIDAKKVIDKVLKNDHYDKIYLATDDVNTYNFFIENYGDMIIRTNRIRSSGDRSIHHHMPEQSGYIKGLDAILDMEALAKCKFLVRMISNLSATSMIVNQDLEAYNLNCIIGNDLKDPETGLPHEERYFNISSKPYNL